MMGLVLRSAGAQRILLVITVIVGILPHVDSQCQEGVACDQCQLPHEGEECSTSARRRMHFFCDPENNTTRLNPHAYVACVNDTVRVENCEEDTQFDAITQDCSAVPLRRGRKRSSGSRTGDMCAFNTDCQSGMYCFNGVCTCLSDYVAISGYCWQKVNPGESGCVEDMQCEAVWPAAKCSRAGICECPEHTVPSKTRDGTVCVSSSVPPSCPLPEPNNPEIPNPATILANPTTHPLAPESYMPVLCTSTSTETQNSNKGDGSSWCVYPDGDNDIYVADIYNCLQHPQVTHEFFPEYAETVDGICCHSRAFVCIQPMEQGEEPSIPRWWYNSVTGTCSQFLWDPNQADGVSPNNFRTIEHCESYCRDTCRRGPNQFSRRNRENIFEETPVTNCLHQSGSCGTEFHCTLIGSHQHCCPTIANMCSPLGGRALGYAPADNYDAGVAIAGSRIVSRFYYDTEQGRCLSFTYTGLGNFNNFLTKQDCENFCSKLVCEYGNPLRIGEDWQRCETSADCPSSHQCESAHKVCCPTAQSICTQPKRHGDCTSSVRRYWYNAATRQCEMFQYTGCQGNDNNFDTLLECQQKCRNIASEPKCPQGRAHRDSNGNFYKCSTKNGGKTCPPNYQCFFDGSSYGCCPTKAYTCSLSPDKGVQCGSGRSFRYYFNSNKQTCETFQYEGCDGNANNFQSVDDCHDYCGVGGCPNGGQPLRDVATNQFAQCTEVSGCPGTHECVAINFNGNAAYRCCPTKAHICSLPPQQGSQCTKMSITRYYFNIVTKECGKFSYNGCSGNLNNFGTGDQCTNFCSSAACAPGEITYKDVNTKQLVECSPTLVNSCPMDFTCKHDTLSTRHVCCGTPPTDVCPDGEKAYMNAMDEAVKECTINVPGSCPANYLCRFSPSRNRYFCCASKTGNVCPDGKALFRMAKTLQPTRCTLNTPMNTCPDSFTCQSRVPNVLQGYCCSAQNVCREGGEFLIDEKTKMPKLCMPGSFQSCPNGYRCYKSAGNHHGYCCKGETTAVTEGCPPGEYAYMKRSEVIQCDPFNIQNKGCPPKYTCQYATSFQRYQCCGKEPIEEDEMVEVEQGCPQEQVAFVDPNTSMLQLCTSSAPNSCPVGYFCQFSDRNKQFQCCAHKAGCPGSTVAYVDISGQSQSCQLGMANQCPSGYGCAKNKDGKSICCTAHGPMANATTTTSTRKPKTTTEATLSTEPPTSVEENVVQGSSTEKEDDKHEKPTSGESRAVSSQSIESVLKGIGPQIGNCRPNEIMKNGMCMPRTFGDPCEASDQCPPTSLCLSFTCECPKGTKPQNGKCVSEQSIDEDRTKERETDEDDKSVEDQTEERESYEELSTTRKPLHGGSTRHPLTCRQDEVMHQGRCLRKVQLGAVCSTDKQCQYGAKCLHDVCRCPPPTAGYDGRCIANACGDQRFKVPELTATSSVVKCRLQTRICTPPHVCSYSKSLKDFICCKSTKAMNEVLKTKSTKSNKATAKPHPRPKSRGSPNSIDPEDTPSLPTWTTKPHIPRRAGDRHRRCPAGLEPYIYPGIGPLECTLARSCPRGYTCVSGICCKPTTTWKLNDNENSSSTTV